MDDKYVIHNSGRAENWKKRNGSGKDPIFGRIITNSIIALVLAGCILLIAFADTPITTQIRGGLENVLSNDLDIKETLGDLFYIEGWSSNQQVSGNSTVDELLYMPATGTVASQAGEEPAITVTCDRYIGIYATADGVIEDILTPAEGGTVILLRHTDKLLSIYTGCDKIYVQKGAKVTRKQLLGNVAESEEGYLLDYQLMNGETALDPMEYIEYAGENSQ